MSQKPTSLPPLALFTILALAILVRGFHVVAIGESPFGDLLIGDARSYDRWAQEIAGGSWIGTQTFYQAPLYPYALGVLYATAGRDPMTVRWAQTLLGSLACVVLALAATRWFSAREGIAAGVLMALYPPAVFFDGLVQKAALDNVLMCVLLAMLGTYTARGGRRRLVGIGAVLGLFALTRENALVFAVVLLAWLPFHLREVPWARRAAAAGMLVAGIAIVLVPVGLRNAVVGGDFLITTAQAGSNFFIGNNAQSDGRYVPLRPGREMPEFERTDATELAENAVGRKLTPAEVSSYWWSRSFTWIREHPGAWLTLLGKKWLLTWNHLELPDTESLELQEDFSWPIRALGRVMGFGVLLALASAGMVLAWSRSPRPVLLYAMLFAFAAAVAAFYVFARYRFPMVPILVLFAAHAIVRCVDAVRARAWRTMIPAGVGSLLGATIAALPVFPVGTSAFAYENIGIGFSREKRFAEAVPFLEEAIVRAPSAPGPYYNLGVALMNLGREEPSGAAFAAAIRLNPDHAAAHDNLGGLLAKSGDLASAERHFREAYRVNPSSPLTLNNLGNVAFELRRPTEAADWYRKALAAKPDYVDARLNLAQAWIALGRTEDARRELREAMRIEPGNREAIDVLREIEGER